MADTISRIVRFGYQGPAGPPASFPDGTGILTVANNQAETVLFNQPGMVLQTTSGGTASQWAYSGSPKWVVIGPNGTQSGNEYEVSATAAQTVINTAITALNNVGGGVVYLMPGTYTLTGQINLKEGVTLQGAGKNATFIEVNYAATTTDAGIIAAVGTGPIGSTVTLNASTTSGNESITLTSGHGLTLVADDYTFLYDSVAWDVNSSATRYRGELLKVLSQSTDTININGKVRDVYASATASFTKVSFMNHVGVRDLTMRRKSGLVDSGNQPCFIRFKWVSNGFVDNCDLGEYFAPAIVCGFSIGCNFTRNYIHNLSDNSGSSILGYGILFANATENSLAVANVFSRCRHALDTGQYRNPSGVVNSAGVPRNCLWGNNAVSNCTNGGISTHGESADITVIGNRVSSSTSYGIEMRGPGSYVVGNTVTGCEGGIRIGNPASTTLTLGEGSQVVGNIIRDIRSDGAGNEGIGIELRATDHVVVKGNTITQCDSAGMYLRRYTRRCMIEDNTIQDCNVLNSGTLTAAIQFENSYSVATDAIKFNIIRNNSAYNSNPQGAGDRGATGLMSHVVKNVNTNHTDNIICDNFGANLSGAAALSVAGTQTDTSDNKYVAISP